MGEWVQLDGSHHDWLEGHGPRCVLMALTEDATSGVRAGSTSMKPHPALDSMGPLHSAAWHTASGLHGQACDLQVAG